jgi:hypothetical protein
MRGVPCHLIQIAQIEGVALKRVVPVDGEPTKQSEGKECHAACREPPFPLGLGSVHDWYSVYHSAIETR